ncbi:hypothetical protein PAEPH01_2742, partial [Pancytospora epiphaga]
GETLKLTEAFKRKNKQFVWADEMNDEFKGITGVVLRGLRELALPDYEKKFMLRTDTSGTSKGTVLLQQDRKCEWLPV